MPAPIAVRDLRKHYGPVQAVQGVSFIVEAGEIFGLLGPNGAGKTSVLECLVGLREADAGEIEVCGLNARTHAMAVKERMGVALQTTALQDKITPREALHLFGSFYRQHVPPETLLARFDLQDKADASFSSLSGGQRQRLALALAFVNQPSVVLLDEPTSGLDPAARRELHRHILQMKADGCAVILSTHHLEEAEQLCDRVAILDHGRIVATGVPRELIAQSQGEQAVTLTTNRPVRLELLEGLPAATELTAVGMQIRFRTSDGVAALGALLALLREQGIELVDLEVRKSTLEDIFLGLTEPTAGGNQR